MDGILPIVVILALLFLFRKRVKIPKGLKPVPALELEFASHYEATIFLNQKELIRLPVSDDMIADFKNDKGRLSKSSKILKYKREGSGYEVLLNLSDELHLEENFFTIDVKYIKHKSRTHIKNFGEIDYALAYIDDGKLLLDSDIQEKNIKFPDAQGNVSAEFSDLAEKVRKRMDAIS